jgi:uncharacterized phosphosugar-binding protein
MSDIAAVIAARLGALYAQISGVNERAVAAAADLIADAVRDDRVVHAFGPGAHSQLGIQEIFYRPGMLAAIAPTIDEGTLLTAGAVRSTRAERTPGRADALVAASGVGPGDVAILVNTAGVNATVIETARAVHARGATLIGYSSTASEEAVPPRHPSRFSPGAALSTECDVHVDTCVPPGDAEAIPGEATAIPLAVAAQSFALLWTFTQSARLLADAAPVWASSYAAGGDARNAELLAKYAPRVAAL